MKKFFCCVAISFPAIGLWAAAGTAPPPPLSVEIALPPLSNDYVRGPDAIPQPGVPAGKIFKFHISESKVFPGTTRTITVYIPAAYRGDKPACLFVFFGGAGPNDVAPVIFDNLIFQHKMPVTIAVAISAGVVNSAAAPENPRFERSLEDESLTDRMPRFVIEEVLPAVKSHTTPDGKPILISDDPNDRGTGGNSSGGFAAFNLAWQRSDSFHRVFTTIGTFVDMRGGERFYSLVRKTEPRPLRVFMEDGVNDQCDPITEMGDWSMSNQTMERALKFNGYNVNHIWGAGGHNNNHAAAIMPAAMIWLWADWPAPVRGGASQNPALKAILPIGEGWQVAADECPGADDLACDPQGRVSFRARNGNYVLSQEGGKQAKSGPAPILAYGAEGKAYDPGVLAGLAVRALTVRNNGDAYAVCEAAPGEGELWLLRAGGQKLRLAGNIKGPSGVALSPDGLWLFVSQSRSRWGLNFRVNADGTTDLPEPFYDFWVADSADASGAAGICMDRDGRAFAATPMGVQIFDRNGRLMAILPLPGNAAATSICFGGSDFGTLYAASDGKIFQRKLRHVGAPPWGAPIKLPHWGEG